MIVIIVILHLQCILHPSHIKVDIKNSASIYLYIYIYIYKKYMVRAAEKPQTLPREIDTFLMWQRHLRIRVL